MTSYVSQCPNCDTSFKVTDAQLAVAAGAVRCGACLQVFVANDYFVDPPVVDLYREREEQEQHSETAISDSIETKAGAIEEPAVDHLSLEADAQDSVDDTDENTGEEAYLIPTGLEGIASSAPEELVGEFVPPSHRQTGRWLAGSIVLSLLLGVQYFWFNKDILAVDTRFRAYYLSFCNVTNCELPVFLDAETLSTTDLL